MKRMTLILTAALATLTAAACDDLDAVEGTIDGAIEARSGTPTDLKIASWQSEGVVYSKAYCFQAGTTGDPCACPAFDEVGVIQDDNKCTLCRKDEWPCTVTPNAMHHPFTVELQGWGARSAYATADASDGSIMIVDDATLGCGEQLDFAVLRSSPSGGGYVLSAGDPRSLAAGC